MAANTKQGQGFGVLLVGITVACAGIAGFSSGLGKLTLLVGIVVTAVSLWQFVSIKSLEGKTAVGSQPASMKLTGVVVTLLGWLVVLFGLHLTSSVGGRLITTLVGLGVSLVGVCVILPTACNKNAIWKS